MTTEHKPHISLNPEDVIARAESFYQEWAWDAKEAGDVAASRRMAEALARAQLTIERLEEQLEASHAEIERLKMTYGEGFQAAREMSELREQLEAYREALDWIEAQPEDPAKVQERARAVLYPAREPEARNLDGTNTWTPHDDPRGIGR